MEQVRRRGLAQRAVSCGIPSLVLGMAVAGCGSDVQPVPSVDYTTTAPLSAFQATAGTSAQPAGAEVGRPPVTGTSSAAGAPTASSAGGQAPPTSSVGGAAGMPAVGTGWPMGAAGTATPPAGSAGMGAPTLLGGSGPALAAGSGSEVPAATRPTKLNFEFTTVSYRGRYAPKNVGAVWIEDGTGKWVYTLAYWGSSPNDTHLTRYNQAAGSAHDYAMSNPLLAAFGGSKFVVMPPPDVITGATLNQHQTHTGINWSLKDSMGADAPDGDYRIVIEITEDDLSEKSTEVPFTLGPGAQPVMPQDTPVFTSMKLTFQ